MFCLLRSCAVVAAAIFFFVCHWNSECTQWLEFTFSVTSLWLEAFWMAWRAHQPSAHTHPHIRSYAVNVLCIALFAVLSNDEAPDERTCYSCSFDFISWLHFQFHHHFFVDVFAVAYFDLLFSCFCPLVAVKTYEKPQKTESTQAAVNNAANMFSSASKHPKSTKNNER